MTNVEKVYVKEGDVVAKGDKIISFSGTSLFKAPFAGSIIDLYLLSPKINPQSTP